MHRAQCRSLCITIALIRLEPRSTVLAFMPLSLSLPRSRLTSENPATTRPTHSILLETTAEKLTRPDGIQTLPFAH